MRILSRLLACLVISTLALGAVLSAQDEQKDDKAKKDKDVAAEKKPDEAKPEEKKPDEKKPDDKKGEDEKPKRKLLDDILEGKTEDKKDVEEKVVWSQVLTSKIRSINERDFVLEVMMPDPEKLMRLQQWKIDQARAIAQATTRDDLNRRSLDYQRELARRLSDPNNTQTMKELPVRASDKVIVRNLYPPQEYDDKGFMKRWTTTELRALRGKTRYEGYPAAWEDVRAGQTVRAYFAKVERVARKAKLLEDDVAIGSAKPEIVMVVIVGETPTP